jgi:large subunit ribosomal protein L31
MKKNIHPEMFDVEIRCACGNIIPTMSTEKELSIDICSNCHPFYTGKQKFVDTAGRIDKFMQRYGGKKK